MQFVTGPWELQPGGINYGITDSPPEAEILLNIKSTLMKYILEILASGALLNFSTM